MSTSAASYRPQFPYKLAPEGCTDQRCVYSFDYHNTPRLAMVIPAGDQFLRIPLQLDKDADFFLRGFVTSSIAGIEIRLEDPRGHALSDIENLDEEMNFQYPGLYSQSSGAGIVALDSDDYGVYCVAGSRLYLHIFNTSTVNVLLTPLVINLHGVKRYSGERCAA
jgi:hypothetical protein